MNTQPVYKGKVVTATGYDRLGKFVRFVWRADKADERKAAKEAAGDTIIFVGKPRKALPGEVPLATAKLIQQERAEKAAAKLVSKNKQVAANREATKEKRKTTRPNNPPQPSVMPLIIDALPVYAPHPVKANTGKPVVNLTTGEYFPSRRNAESRPGWGQNSIKEWLLRHSPARVRDNWFAWATEAEQQARQCLRKIRGEVRTRRPYKPAPEESPAIPTTLANASRAKQYIHIPTGKLYPSQLALCQELHIGQARIVDLKLGQVRHTPAGDIRLANKREREKWMRSLQRNGGHMQIAFNTSR